MKIDIPLTKKGRPPKKGGGKLGRNEVLQTRLDIELRYETEMAARSAKRTISSVIEIALERYVKEFVITIPRGVEPSLEVPLPQFVKSIWDDNEVVRFLNLAQAAPSLLSPEEKQIWSILNAEPYFWRTSSTSGKLEPYIDLIKRMWNTLQVINESSEIEPFEIQKHLLELNKSCRPDKIAALRKAIDDLYPDDLSN